MLREFASIVTNDNKVFLITGEDQEPIEGITFVKSDTFSQIRSFVNLFGQAYVTLKGLPDFTAMRPVAVQLLTALMPNATVEDIENSFYIFEHSD